MLMRGCNKSYHPTVLKTVDSDTTQVETVRKENKAVAVSQPDWDQVDFDLPKSEYDEVTDTAIIVKRNEKYTIYSLSENILFAPDQSTLQGSASSQLKMVAASLNKRFKNAEIGVYGHADSMGNASVNKELAEQRAMAVKEWLVLNGHFAESVISVHSLGETKPVADNGTAPGRKQNRSVEIIVFPDAVKN